MGCLYVILHSAWPRQGCSYERRSDLPRVYHLGEELVGGGGARDYPCRDSRQLVLF